VTVYSKHRGDTKGSLPETRGNWGGGCGDTSARAVSKKKRVLKSTLLQSSNGTPRSQEGFGAFTTLFLPAKGKNIVHYTARIKSMNWGKKCFPRYSMSWGKPGGTSSQSRRQTEVGKGRAQNGEALPTTSEGFQDGRILPMTVSDNLPPAGGKGAGLKDLTGRCRAPRIKEKKGRDEVVVFDERQVYHP